MKVFVKYLNKNIKKYQILCNEILIKIYLKNTHNLLNKRQRKQSKHKFKIKDNIPIII